MSYIKPIETRYKNYRFRSRLEARWAIFFDALGIQWEYEKEGYPLPSGPYLPDFWLPQVDMWAEVKGYRFTDEELALCAQLANATEKEVLLLDGMPTNHTYCALNPSSYEHGGWTVEISIYDIQDGNRYWIDEARFYCDGGDSCDFGGDPFKPFPAKPNASKFLLGFCRKNTEGDERALKAARSARFEHGEQG